MSADTIRWGALWWVLVACGGCGSGEVEVSGKVSYLGQSVSQGGIKFEDPTGKFPAQYSPIEAGQYQVTLLPGEKIVRITATQETGKMIAGGMGDVPEVVDILPPRFNSQSELRCQIEARAQQSVDFDLP